MVRPQLIDSIYYQSWIKSASNLSTLVKEKNVSESLRLIDHALDLIQKADIAFKTAFEHYILANKAVLLNQSGEIVESLSTMLIAVEVCFERFGSVHPDLRELYSITGRFLSDERFSGGDLGTALSSIVQLTVNAKSAHAVTMLGGVLKVVELLREKEKLTEAYLLDHHARRIMGLALKAKDIEIAFSLNELALSFQREDQHAKAEPLLRQALSIQETFLNKNHPDVALALNNLGCTLVNLGEFYEAECLLSRATESSTTFADSHYWLAKLYQLRNQPKDQEREVVALKRYLEAKPTNEERKEEAKFRITVLERM